MKKDKEEGSLHQLTVCGRESVGRTESKVPCGPVSRNEKNLMVGPLCSKKMICVTLQVVTFLS